MTPQQEEAIADAMAAALASQADTSNGMTSPPPKASSQLGRTGLSQIRTSSAISQMPLQMQHSQH